MSDRFSIKITAGTKTIHVRDGSTVKIEIMDARREEGPPLFAISLDPTPGPGTGKPRIDPPPGVTDPDEEPKT